MRCFDKGLLLNTATGRAASRLLLRVALGVFPLVLAAQVRAECIICDELIVLDAFQAECYSDNYDQYLSRLNGHPEGRLPIDMNECAREVDRVGVRGGILTMPDPEGPDMTEGGKSVYLLDSAGAQCLKSLIDEHEGQYNPSTTFDLFESCSE